MSRDKKDEVVDLLKEAFPEETNNKKNQKRVNKLAKNLVSAFGDNEIEVSQSNKEALKEALQKDASIKNKITPSDTLTRIRKGLRNILGGKPKGGLKDLAKNFAEGFKKDEAAAEEERKAEAERQPKEVREKLERQQRIKEAREKLEEFFKSKTAAKQSDFTKKGKKKKGFTDGYIATRKDDGHLHMLKNADKDNPRKTRDKDNKRDFLTEFMMGRFYKRILYDRSPEINIATTDDGSKKSTIYGWKKSTIYLTSRFFKNFQTLTDFTLEGTNKKRLNGAIDPDSEKIQGINGFEKMLAACSFGGEIDYHASNLGVVPELDEHGKHKEVEGVKQYTLVKIDHGRSAFTYDDHFQMSEDMLLNVVDFEYHNFKFDNKKFIEAANQITSVTDDEIEKFVAANLAELKKQGFDIRKTNTISREKDFGTDKDGNKLTSDQAYGEAERDFIDGFKKRREQLKRVRDEVEEVEKIEFVKNGKKYRKDYLEFRYSMKYNKSPIAYLILSASHNTFEIEGKKPMEWIFENQDRYEKYSDIVATKEKWLKENIEFYNDTGSGCSKTEKEQFERELKEIEDNRKKMNARIAKAARKAAEEAARGLVDSGSGVPPPPRQSKATSKAQGRAP